MQQGDARFQEHLERYDCDNYEKDTRMWVRDAESAWQQVTDPECFPPGKFIDLLVVELCDA